MLKGMPYEIEYNPSPRTNPLSGHHAKVQDAQDVILIFRMFERRGIVGEDLLDIRWARAPNRDVSANTIIITKRFEMRRTAT